MSFFETSQKVLRQLKNQTDEVLLFYSAGGKDGIVLLDMLAKANIKTTCVFMYLVKNMKHTQIYIDYAEKKYGIKTIQYPHFILSRYLKVGQLCVEDVDIPVIELKDIEAQARKDTGIDFIVSGRKIDDGYAIGQKLRYSKPYGFVKRKCYPLLEWKNRHCLNYIKKERLINPMNYGRGDFGKHNTKYASDAFTIDLNILRYLEKNYPEDLILIEQKFPFALEKLHEFNFTQNETASKSK